MVKMKRWQITLDPWRDVVRELLTTYNFIIIASDDYCVARLHNYYGKGFRMLVTNPDGTDPETTYLTLDQALNELSKFFRHERKEPTAAEKINDLRFIGSLESLFKSLS